MRQELLKGEYRAQLGKEVEIPKADGGTRRLGIFTVGDRVIQQAILQVLDPNVCLDVFRAQLWLSPSPSCTSGT